jgi:hypothetical protein
MHSTPDFRTGVPRPPPLRCSSFSPDSPVFRVATQVGEWRNRIISLHFPCHRRCRTPDPRQPILVPVTDTDKPSNVSAKPLQQAPFRYATGLPSCGKHGGVWSLSLLPGRGSDTGLCNHSAAQLLRFRRSDHTRITTPGQLRFPKTSRRIGVLQVMSLATLYPSKTTYSSASFSR